MTDIVDVTMDLGGLVTHEVYTRMFGIVVKESKKWISSVPKPKMNKCGIVAPQDAGNYLRECIPIVEKHLVDIAQEFSSIQWLWYLRRTPDFVLQGKLYSTISYAFALAETLSSQSQIKESRLASQSTLIYPLNQTVVNHVLRFTLGCRYLSQIHSYLRWSGKGVDFRFKGNNLPAPIKPDHIRTAVELYDKRADKGISIRSGILPFNRSGTLFVRNIIDDKVLCIYINRVIKPHFLSNLYQLLNKIPDPENILYRFLPWSASLSDLAELIRIIQNYSDEWVDQNIGSILTLLCLVPILLTEYFGVSITIPHYGYSVHLYKVFTTEFADVVKDVSDELSKMMPEVHFPENAEELINRLRSLDTSTWPLNPGPIVRGNKDFILFDFLSATAQLNYRLEFLLPQGGPLGNIRGRDFEDATQDIINRSNWKPLPELLKLRQRKLTRDENGKERDITDIDAIGSRNGCLLIVSCKAQIYSAQYDMGDYRVVRNAATHLDRAVMEWQQVKNVFTQYPIGRNYNFSAYTTIVAVVCTPHVIYTSKPETLEMEVDGLHRAVSTSELFDWLDR